MPTGDAIGGAILYTKVPIAQILIRTDELNKSFLFICNFYNKWLNHKITTVFLLIISTNNNFYKRMPVCLTITAPIL